MLLKKLECSVIIFICDPLALKLSNQNSSDTLFCFLFSLFVLSQLYIYKKGLNFKLIFLSALLLGAATFTRAVSMYVSIVVIFMMLIVFWKDESKVKIAKYLIVFVSIQMMIIGGWQSEIIVLLVIMITQE